MTESSHHATILVAVDGSAASAAAVRWAAAEAVRRHARLHAVHVVEHGPHGDPAAANETRRDLELARQTVPGRVGDLVFGEAVDVDIAVSVVTGDVVDQLAREAGDATLVVIGTPEGIEHEALPEALAPQCLCPVAMVGAHGGVAQVGDSADRPAPRGAGHARP
jgi:nucleotide-binding universal stress UspA family protein